MRSRKSSIVRISGAAIFMLTVAMIAMVSILVYDRVRATEGITKPQIALVMLLVIVFLALLCTIADAVRRRIMVEEPTTRILVATERIADGDFSYRTEIKHKYGNYDEYDVIMDNINSMAEALEKSEVLRTDFISNVSHELKTPIAVIRSYATLLKENPNDPEREKYVSVILSASDRLGSLVGNILKLNKLENGDLRREYETVDLTAMLADSVLAFESVIEKKEIDLVCDLDDVSIRTVPSYLEIVWNNLISNALKFTDKGGIVTLTLRGDENGATVKIRDTGCGISPETGGRIFEKFYQGDTSHKEEGNGLGLALVKKVIDLVGGEISVTSEVGCSTEFTVVLKDIQNER